MQQKSLFALALCLLFVSMLIGCTTMRNTTVKNVESTNKFPEKPITVIVPFTAGGGTDLIARALEKVAPKYLGQSLMVVNKAGGAGTIGWNELASSNPDGYTIGICTSDLLLEPLYGSTRYHYMSALDPIAQISSSSTSAAMIVRADKPWRNVQELVEYAKKYPGKLKFAHSGLGGMAHVIGESFARSADINIEQVPFNGGSESMAALLGNHVDIAFVNVMTIKEQITGGTIKALAMSSEKRLSDPLLGQIPTFKEQGFDVAINYRIGVAAPKDTPPEIERKLTAGFNAMIFDPEFKKRMDALGVEIEYLEPKEFKDAWIDDSVNLNKIIEETGILDEIKGQKH